MDHFDNALRQAIYLLECPLQKIATAAKCGRTTVYTAMRGGERLRPNTARALAFAVCDEINEQIERRNQEIEELKRREISLRAAYNREFGGGWNDRRPKKTVEPCQLK